MDFHDLLLLIAPQLDKAITKVRRKLKGKDINDSSEPETEVGFWRFSERSAKTFSVTSSGWGWSR